MSNANKQEPFPNTYSATLRMLNKKSPNKVKEFMESFKNAFDDAIENGVEDHQNVALLQAQRVIAKHNQSDMLSLAQAMVNTTRSAQEVGVVLAKIINILIDKIPHNKQAALKNMRDKILMLNPTEISTNNLPETAAYGQSITLIKTLLNGYSPEYIKQVILSTAGALY